MEAQAATRRDLETALIEKCWKDPEFKKQVITDPKGMLERHTGQKLPPQVRIVIHEEDANTLHFSIPLAPSNLTELSDDDLERVAGGTDLVVTAVTAVLGAVASAATAATASAAVATATKTW
jgi:Nitrile hydratase, alpha chain